MTAASDLHLSLSVTLKAAGGTPEQADNALDRMAGLIYRMNAQDGVTPPARKAGAPLSFSLSAPVDAPSGGAVGALMMIQMLTLHMGSALSAHHGTPIVYEGEVVTGAVLRSALVGEAVGLGPVDAFHYTLKDSVFLKADGQEAFPDIVARARKTPAGLEESLTGDAGTTAEASSPTRPRLRR